MESRLSTSRRARSLQPPPIRTPTKGVEEVHVAVGREVFDGKMALMWAVRNVPSVTKIVLVHVHQPSLKVPMMGGWFPQSRLQPMQVEAHRRDEMDKINKILDEVLRVVSERPKVQTEKVVFEMDSIAKGLIEVIFQRHIAYLVMGAAADKQYSKKMTAPKSKTACAVRKDAPPFCNIWFVCKGNLIATKESINDGYRISQFLIASPSSKAIQMERSQSVLPSRNDSSQEQDYSNNYSRSDNNDDALIRESSNNGCRKSQFLIASPRTTQMERSKSVLPSRNGSNQEREYSNNYSRSNSDDSFWGESANTGTTVSSDEMILKSFSDAKANQISPGNGNARTFQGMRLSQNDEEVIKMATKSTNVTEKAAHKFEEDADFSFGHMHMVTSKVEVQREHALVDDEDDLYRQLRQVLLEASNRKVEAHKESLRRSAIEMELLDANRRAKALEAKYAKEVKLRGDVQEKLLKGKMEVQKLKNQSDGVFKELQVQSDRVVKEFEEKLLAAQKLIVSLYEERDAAVREIEDIEEAEEAGSRTGSPNFLEFSQKELEHATSNFDNSMKIGTGGYGNVFKGVLRHLVVTIKILHSQSLRSQHEFQEEVEMISRLRHPNLVTLIGACSEKWALVYEFLPNGTLEDHLACKDSKPPLPWQVRVRIIIEICSALIFLHSHKPEKMVHGDLKAANILLDGNFVSKISDFGIRRFMQSNTNTLYRWTDPKGTFVYLDPEFFSTGELNAKSDVYSFGILVLRLLTGRSALGIVKEVQESVAPRGFVLDSKAGNWPPAEGRQLVQLGLSCSEMNRRNRPDLVKDVWKILAPMRNAVT